MKMPPVLFKTNLKFQAEQNGISHFPYSTKQKTSAKQKCFLFLNFLWKFSQHNTDVILKCTMTKKK